MDSVDDDFGELYVDDKVEASDAFPADVGLVNSCAESECAGNDRGFEGIVKADSEGEMKKFDVVAKDSSPCDDACAEESECNDSDSDDDLRIVLKDDDSKAFPAAEHAALEASKTCSFQRRWTRYASADNACIDQSSGMSQHAYSFSNPWSRTPFDANSHAFEKKPWRNHGTDITDFFNFGLNEQSWKDYCKPLGRAIEVKGGTLERIPSTDLRPPRDSDPDVVIQIPLTNDVEELSIMTPEKARCTTSNEASKSEDSRSNNGKDLNSVDDSPKDEAYVGCQDDTGSFSGQKPPTENCYSREVATPCDKEMTEEEKEDSSYNSDEADPSLVESVSSLGDRICLSPTSSCSVGKHEESDDYETESLKDSATDEQREVSTPPRRARLAEYEAISIKSGERSGTKHSRHRRSHEDSNKRHCGRAGYAVHGYVKDASPTPDPGCGKKISSRHESLYRDSNKNWEDRPLITLERDETEGNGVLYYRENCHGRLSSVDRARHREHMFGWWNNKESSLGRGFDHSNCYKYEARPKEYTPRSSFNLNQRNPRSSFKEEDDRYGWHHCERKYGHEKSHVRAYENNKERNGYDWLREPYYEDCTPITDMDYRYRSEYSSAHGIDNHKQSLENDLHCRRGVYDYNLHRHRYEDGYHMAESRIPFELPYREMRTFAEVERREYQEIKRNEEFTEIEKRHHYTHDWHLDRFVSEKDGYKYRTQDGWPSPSLSLKDSWYTKEAKGDFRRDDTGDFRTAGAYDSQNNQFHKAALRDGWKPNRGYSNNASRKDRLKYDDDWVRPDRGRYMLADDIQGSMIEVTHSEHPSYTDEILVRDIGIPTRNGMATKQRSGYCKNHIHEIDERHQRSKKLRGNGHAFIKCQDPVNLTGRRGKLLNQSKRRFVNGEDTIEQQDGQKSGKLICKREEKAVQIRDLNDKEEGEIIEEANGKVVEIDDKRIQESLKKMEKRRERFKETKLARMVEATSESQMEPRAKASVTNQQRPIRKRRWCATG